MSEFLRWHLGRRRYHATGWQVVASAAVVLIGMAVVVALAHYR